MEKQPRRIIDKNVQTQAKGLYRAENGGNDWRDIPKEQGEKQVLSDKEILELSEIILRIESHYGFPCDIEWAQENGKFFIVQSRPITTLERFAGFKKKLQKIVTRFYYPITIQAWFNGATKELKKIIGVGFSDVIIRFDGKKVEVFRIAEELHTKVKTAMLCYVATKNFSDGLRNYEKVVKEYDKILSEGNNILKATRYFEKIYPMFAVSYFVSNLWVDELPSNQKEQIIKLCTEYRKLSDGILNKLDQFVADFLKKRGLSYFTTLDMIEIGKNSKVESLEWLKNRYIFSKGKFQNISWTNFLQDNGFIYEEKIIPSSAKTPIRGSIAFVGKVKGVAKIVFSPLDFGKVETGDILVSPMTQPTFVPILSKIAGIITDEGGVTCHAAIVARELRKPCIIGTKNATQILKDGDIVEVDANNGIVKILKYGVQ